MYYLMPKNELIERLKNKIKALKESENKESKKLEKLLKLAEDKNHTFAL